MKIDITEILRYLGYKNQVLDENIKILIDQCIKEIQDISKKSYVYKFYDIDKTDSAIKLIDTNVLLTGDDIMYHLKYSSKCAVMAVTLGAMVDSKIKYYEKTNLTKALIMDSCATAAVESVCDEVEEKIKEEAFFMGFGITYRYSPGYGDLPIELQHSILTLLETYKKIGLTVSENSILLPRKSVTAIIGLQGLQIKREASGCRTCNNFQFCQFRKEGNYCGT